MAAEKMLTRQKKKCAKDQIFLSQAPTPAHRHHKREEINSDELGTNIYVARDLEWFKWGKSIFSKDTVHLCNSIP